jgi:Mn2+/Fe2+ NRAMP family transporter
VRRLGSILFWSVISAAFIGPGTVTTAASAGASFELALLWALVFSTGACLALQEAAARITVCSGHDLGQALRLQYPRGAGRLLVLTVVLGAVVLGCAAYEAGNILGGVAAATLSSSVPASVATIGIGVLAFALLWFGRTGTVARLLGLLVAVMGAAFVYTAWALRPEPVELLRGALVPRAPDGSGLLVLGLIGTTVVPYNLFLGSGLARGRDLGELRFGLTVAIVLGGAVSAAIVVVGGAVDGSFGFDALSDVLVRRLGPTAEHGFAVGLAAAGISSAITAPLAAAITTRGLLADPRRGSGGPWDDRGSRFRGVWIAVLGTGVLFGLTGVRPVPAILVAQALNGVLLPSVAVFLLLAVNDRALMGSRGLNGAFANAWLGLVVAVTVALGVASLARALAVVTASDPPGPRRLLLWSVGLVVAGALPLWRRARRLRRARAEATHIGSGPIGPLPM